MNSRQFKIIIDTVWPILSSAKKNIVFDYPDYAGIRKSVADKLSPEAVDAMQDILHEEFKDKLDFCKRYLVRLHELGEPLPQKHDWR